jgi:anti-sigma regulatory factor (Ser/Thr protein kinase)
MSTDPTLMLVPGESLKREFLPEPGSAPAARKFVLGLGWSNDSGVNLRLATVVSEVVTNAIIHAGTPFSVSVLASESAIHVAVKDGSTILPARRKHETVQGRGLDIINAMADRWGVTRQLTGKTVWFEMEKDGAALIRRPDAEGSRSDF